MTRCPVCGMAPTSRECLAAITRAGTTKAGLPMSSKPRRTAALGSLGGGGSAPVSAPEGTASSASPGRSPSAPGSVSPRGVGALPSKEKAGRADTQSRHLRKASRGYMTTATHRPAPVAVRSAGPDAMCRCGHGMRHHREGNITEDRRSCMALGFHSGVPFYNGSECYAFEPDTSVIILRRDARGRFVKVAS